MSKVKLIDIAQEADVSVSTVSRVLNGVPTISPVVRDHVLKVAEQLGYSKKPQKKQERFLNFGVICDRRFPHIIQYNVFDQLYAGLEGECSKQNIQLTYLSEVGERDVSQSLDGIDGVLAIAVDANKTLDMLDNARVPVGLINSLQGQFKYDTTVPGGYWGARIGTNYLLDEGHSDIVLIKHNQRETTDDRERGFRDAIRERLGADVTPPVFSVSVPPETWEVVQIIKEVQAKQPVTAVFCTNDMVAFACLEAAQEMGLRVPQDISVLGFDNVPFSQRSTPPISTIDIDFTEVSREAVRKLIDRVKNKYRRPVRSEIAAKLVKRKSVATLKN
ncbi:LacI family transcriptional regulator [Rhodobacteraceae bacterium RKSG542]|uniref:LacI family DNA-binding transcriptional regulator n=1 Tax=Pseudovibrio flavus TaxID=2529854 RepID=UPI0012BD60F4|nr:LacI family DNA-binding transcriptional regulator [Pseudovibrio flavus]MTI16246.1 LacI family transcriptional regulator [Pseudovibrio flavus]